MKQKLKELHLLLREIGDLYNFKMVITASVIVQNMTCYDDNWKESDFQPYLSILKKMSEFNPYNHVLYWAYDEANTLVENYLLDKADQSPES